MTDSIEMQEQMRKEAALEKGFRFLSQECQDGFFSCSLSDTPRMQENLRSAPRDVASSVLILQTILSRIPPLPQVFPM